MKVLTVKQVKLIIRFGMVDINWGVSLFHDNFSDQGLTLYTDWYTTEIFMVHPILYKIALRQLERRNIRCRYHFFE